MIEKLQEKVKSQKEIIGRQKEEIETYSDDFKAKEKEVDEL